MGRSNQVCRGASKSVSGRSEEHTSELQSQSNLVCRLLLEKKKMSDSLLQARGVSDDSRIVIYSSDDLFAPTTRLYLLLAWAGLRAHTSLLACSLPACLVAH